MVTLRELIATQRKKDLVRLATIPIIAEETRRKWRSPNVATSSPCWFCYDAVSYVYGKTKLKCYACLCPPEVCDPFDVSLATEMILAESFVADVIGTPAHDRLIAILSQLVEGKLNYDPEEIDPNPHDYHIDEVIPTEED